MILVISPSKTLDFSNHNQSECTNSDFLEESFALIKILRNLTISEISVLMNLSKKLASLNYQRYLDFVLPFNLENSRQAIYAFKGDVYDGLDVETFKQSDISYAQSHLRIISGLYGLLKPLDLIQPYRLEMGTKLTNKHGKNLYEYWGDTITIHLNELLKNKSAKLLVNLTSLEYFKVINKKLLQGSLITPIFKERKNGDYKIVPIFAKRARGMMASYIIKNRIQNISDIKQFNKDGYVFNKSVSNENELVFTR
ncbi:MAG: peroxide stress protein YaaA [Rickettsiaceae bacterium]